MSILNANFLQHIKVIILYNPQEATESLGAFTSYTAFRNTVFIYLNIDYNKTIMCELFYFVHCDGLLYNTLFYVTLQVKALF